MTRLSLSLGSLGFCWLTGCAGRAVDLDHAAPASSALPSSDPFVAPTDESSGVWVDDQRLYWLSGFGRVQSCLKLDCEHTRRTYAQLNQGPITATVGGGHVYWTSSQLTIFSCPVEGCAAEPVTVVRDPAFRNTLFADRGYVYWSSDFDIYRCPASGCATTPEVVAQSVHADYLVFDDTRAYWSGFSAPSDGSEPPQNLTAPVPVEGAPLGKAAPPAPMQSLAVGAGYLYWTTGNQVFRCPTASCNAAPPTLLVTGEAPITSLKLDDSAMYWLETDSIHSCPLFGCEQSRALTPAKVTHEGIESARYAIDASYLYWLEAPDEPRTTTRPPMPGGIIRRTAK